MKKFLLLTAVVLSLICVNTLIAQTPTITSFSPSSGAIGTLVTIVGTNLSNPSAFTVGGTNAIMVSDTFTLPINKGDTLVGLVMPGSVTGTISVTTVGGTAISGGNFTVTPTPFPGAQQGNKLVGAGAVHGGGGAYQGQSVGISADGSTCIVGGVADNNYIGAAWVYTRSGGIWSQQGSKLVGTGAAGLPAEGESVSISADGNTAIVGGYSDSSGVGAAWVFTRSGGIWTQQGNKLVGTGASNVGQSVSISADGNTALIGGKGASWVFTRSGGIWTQQGNKLVGTGATGPEQNQGIAVSLSADGSTAVIGSPGDNNYIGAAWVFVRSGGTWTQQGSKLVGTGYKGKPFQGSSVSVSGDGNTAIVGGAQDSSTTGGTAGAVWVYTRSSGTWTQQGSKLVGTGATINAYQGNAVSLSADGNTAVVGGIRDYNSGHFTGATWVYTRSGGSWTQQGSKLVGTGVPDQAYQGTSISISADGSTTIVGGWADNSGAGAAWVFIPPCKNTGDTTAQVCSSFKWYGTTYSTSATPTYILTNVAGCDSTVTLHLTIIQPTNGDTTANSCVSFKWYGTTYSSSGTPTYNLTNKAGCDSTVTLHLTINPLPNISITGNNTVVSGVNDTLTAHGGVSYVWSSGSHYDTTMIKQVSATTYTVVGTDAHGCQNTATLNVTMNISSGVGNLSSSTYPTLYPNPAGDIVSLNFDVQGSDMAATLVILDISGKELLREQKLMENNKVMTMDVSSLPPGSYLIKVITDKSSQVMKFIKQ